MKKRWLFPIALVLLISLLAACTNRAFDAAYADFKQAYLSATAFTEPSSNDVVGILSRMDAAEFEKDMQHMKDSLDRMAPSAKTKQEKKNLSLSQDDYSDLEYLLSARGQQSPTTDEMRKVWVKLGLVQIARDYFTEGN